MSKHELRLIVNSFIIGVQLERLKPQQNDRIKLIVQIGEEINKLESREKDGG